MRIITPEEILQVKKPEGTEVGYYLFDEYEVHFNEQVPGSTQTWHRHEKVWEVLFILEGELTAKWKDRGKVREQVVKKGDLVEAGRSRHTFVNHTDEVVKFLVLKMVLSGENYRELFKVDKVVEDEKV
jgi:uncharacterized cupin superfamily protein